MFILCLNACLKNNTWFGVVFFFLFIPFQTVTEDKYDVRRCVEEAAIIVTSEVEPTASCTITLTSPIMRDTNLPEGGKFQTSSNLSNLLLV